MKQLSLIVLILTFLSVCSFLHSETIAAQGFEAGDTWEYSANNVGTGYWGIMDAEFGGANAHSGEHFWTSWLLGSNEGMITFANQDLPLGYVYSINFHYYTKLLSTPGEYCRYALSYDSGSTWTQWTELLPNTQAWTLVSIEIPVYEHRVMLRVAARHSGTSKYVHWDSFVLNREAAPPSAPVVYNLQIAQRTDGSGLVDIYYDLFDQNNDPGTISLLVSTDAGATYTYVPNPANLSGDIGAGIALGTGKHIIWNVGAEAVEFESNDYRFRILTEDGTTYGMVATPVYDPPAGTYTTAQTVSITCATAGAEIRYTTDGSEPNESSPIYSTPLSVSTTTTLKAKAFKELWTASETAIAVYTIMPTSFVLVPGGTFIMGDTRGIGDSNELPTHNVTLNSFYIGKYEVTQSEWQTVMGANPADVYGVGDNYPVYNVNWYSILKYCNLRSLAEGFSPAYSISGSTNPADWGEVPTSYNLEWNSVIYDWAANGYRLPTEAEWEYAARGATNTPDYLYSGSNILNDVAWNATNNNPYGSKPVGTKSHNGLGIYDMSGNVWEWCWDWFGGYSSSQQNNPTGPSTGTSRVLRGDDWYDSPEGCRVSRRIGNEPNNPYFVFGFRICRSLDSIVQVEGGTFNNGTSDVTVSNFYIDKYELTQSGYQAIMGSNPASGYGVGINHPVYNVSWFNAIEYCNRRSMQEGLTTCYSYSTYGTNPATWPTGWNTSDANHTNVSCNWTANGYRLPTEMEWMFAARGGNQTHNYTYSGSNTIDNVAWYRDNAGFGLPGGSSHPDFGTHIVGSKASNELGIFDMSGNVFEWNWDIYGTYPSGAQTNPHGAQSGSNRVYRGGSWSDIANVCTVSHRDYTVATSTNGHIGFRCVRVSP